MAISLAQRNCGSGKDCRNFKTGTELSRSIQNLKSVGFFALLIMLVGYVGMAEAQQAKKVPRIGYVSGSGDPSNPGPFVDAFRQGLRDRGYIEGKNILVEHRYHEGKVDRVPGLVAELVRLKVDVLVFSLLRAIRAAKQASRGYLIKLRMIRMRFSSSSIITCGKVPILPERLVGYGDQLAYKQIAITGNAGLALFEAKPKDSGVFYKPSSGWNDYCRWIPRFIDEI